MGVARGARSRRWKHRDRAHARRSLDGPRGGGTRRRRYSPGPAGPRERRPRRLGGIVRIIAEHDSLPDSEVTGIEKAIAEAYRGWSDAQRRSTWYETDSGMTDDDEDDSLCDTSFNGIGYALQVEVLDEATRAAWRDAEELKKSSSG